MADGSSPRTTARLLLRPPAPGDVDSYRRLLGNPVVGEWLRPAPLEPFVDAHADLWIEADIEHWREHGFGPWAVIERERGAYLGRVGLKWTEVEGAPTIEVGWVIEPSRHGEGFATEAAGAAFDLARERDIDDFVAMILPNNVASLRVAAKLGMERVGEVEHAGMPHLLLRPGRSRNAGESG